MFSKYTLIYISILLTVMLLLSSFSADNDQIKKSFDRAMIIMDNQSSIPKQIKFSKDNLIPLSSFWYNFKSKFHLSENNEFKSFKTFSDNLGQTHHRYKQYYKSIEIADIQYIIHEKNGLVHLANGRVIKDLNLNITPTISVEQALKSALSQLDAETYMWQNKKSEALLKIDKNDKNATYYPEGKLMISSAGNKKEANDYRLVYRYDIWAEKPMWRYNVDVDANTGEIINKISLIYKDDVQGEGQSLYNGMVQITVSDSIYPVAIPQSFWHVSNWNAYGGEGGSFWLADTSLVIVSGYHDLWYEVMDTDPVLLNGESVQLSFFQRYGIEDPSGTPASYDGWDGMNVRISNDNGASWQVLDNPTPQYISSSLWSFGEIFHEGINVPGWAGTNNEWRNVTFDLSEYSGQTVKIRFAFASDGWVSSWTNPDLFGWLVDNIEIYNSDSTLYYNSGDTATVNFLKIDEGVTDINGNYRLREQARGDGIFTYNMKGVELLYLAEDFVDDDSSFTDPQNSAGVSVHWGLEKTYDYFVEKHDRISYDNDGGSLRSYVHHFWNNAFYLGNGTMGYGDGDGVYEGPLVSVDIAAHEFTHGVTQESANLIYKGEYGALNESFSDIFGESVERYVEGDGDWLMGADITIEGAPSRRSLIDPNSREHPDTYRGNFWAPTGPEDPDNGGVHINSSVQNHWFYLMSEGGSGVNDNGDAYFVTGIGIEEAAQIAYRNLIVYLMPTSEYEDSRRGSLNAANDLFGIGSPQYLAVLNAWNAVGVYYPFIGPHAENATINGKYFTPGSDTLLVQSVINNPKNHELETMLIISSFDQTVRDSIYLFDDGMHEDGGPDDSLWGGNWPVTTAEKIYSIAITTVSLDSGYSNIFRGSEYFTTIGPIVTQGWTKYFVEDSIPNPGDLLGFKIHLKNEGLMGVAENISTQLSSDHPDVTVISGNTNYGDIIAGSTTESLLGNAIEISPNISRDTTIYLPLKISSGGVHFWDDSLRFDIIVSALVENEKKIPRKFDLKQNYPNPFNPSTTIEFDLPKATDVRIEVYNIAGQKIQTPLNEKMAAGTHEVEFNAQDLSSGVYFYRIEATEFQDVKKMILIK
jgi:Zn-dependent metalloprotease